MKYTKHQNVWKPTIQYAHSNGSWRRVKEVSAKVDTNWKSTIPPIGTYTEGGYVAGIIDTLASGGERYLVLFSPKQYQVALQWSVNYSRYPGSEATSKWNGLENTTKLANANYPAANYCANAVINGYDDWYLPAIDELELAYRNFKPSTLMNDYDTSDVYTGQINGYNPSSDPPGPGYSNQVIYYRGSTIDTRINPGRYDFDMNATVSVGYPLQTNIDLFKQNNNQSFWPPNSQQSYYSNYFSSTNHSTTVAYSMFFYSAPCGNPYSKSGRQGVGLNWAVYAYKDQTRYVRPVRRVLI